MHLSVRGGDAVGVDGEVVQRPPPGQYHLPHISPRAADQPQLGHLAVTQVFKDFLKEQWDNEGPGWDTFVLYFPQSPNPLSKVANVSHKGEEAVILQHYKTN